MKTWYKTATNNRSPLPFVVTIKFGSAWLKYRDSYVRALREQEQRYDSTQQRKATLVLRYHRRGLPKELPYVVTITGFEWWFVTRAILTGMGEPHDKVYRRRLQSLYRKFLLKKQKAALDYRTTVSKARTYFDGLEHT